MKSCIVSRFKRPKIEDGGHSTEIFTLPDSLNCVCNDPDKGEGAFCPIPHPFFKGGSRGGSGSQGTCFVEGTDVLTISGYKDIKDIKIDDVVYSYNHELEEVQWKKVTKKFESYRNDLVEITLNDTNTILTSSSNHKYYVIGKGYVEATSLRQGDSLFSINNVSFIVKKVKVKNLKDPVMVYNFTVEGNHNYFVSNSPVLVHNTKDILRFGRPSIRF